MAAMCSYGRVSSDEKLHGSLRIDDCANVSAIQDGAPRAILRSHEVWVLGFRAQGKRVEKRSLRASSEVTLGPVESEKMDANAGLRTECLHVILDRRR